MNALIQMLRGSWEITEIKREAVLNYTVKSQDVLRSTIFRVKAEILDKQEAGLTHQNALHATAKHFLEPPILQAMYKELRHRTNISEEIIARAMLSDIEESTEGYKLSLKTERVKAVMEDWIGTASKCTSGERDLMILMEPISYLPMEIEVKALEGEELETLICRVFSIAKTLEHIFDMPTKQVMTSTTATLLLSPALKETQ